MSSLKRSQRLVAWSTVVPIQRTMCLEMVQVRLHVIVLFVERLICTQELCLPYHGICLHIFAIQTFVRIEMDPHQSPSEWFFSRGKCLNCIISINALKFQCCSSSPNIPEMMIMRWRQQSWSNPQWTVNLPFDHQVVLFFTTSPTFSEADFDVIGWRDVPVNLQVLGSLSADYVPKIRQVVVASKAGKEPPTAKSFNQALYDVRRVIQVHWQLSIIIDRVAWNFDLIFEICSPDLKGKFRKNKYGEAYVCSLSSKTIV